MRNILHGPSADGSEMSKWLRQEWHLPSSGLPYIYSYLEGIPWAGRAFLYVGFRPSCMWQQQPNPHTTVISGFGTRVEWEPYSWKCIENLSLAQIGSHDSLCTNHKEMKWTNVPSPRSHDHSVPITGKYSGLLGPALSHMATSGMVGRDIYVGENWIGFIRTTIHY